MKHHMKTLCTALIAIVAVGFETLVLANDDPDAEVSSPVVACPDEDVTLSGTVSPTDASYSWSTTSGTLGTGTETTVGDSLEVTKAYSNDVIGVHEFTLTATKNSVSDSATGKVAIIELSRIFLAAAPTYCTWTVGATLDSEEVVLAVGDSCTIGAELNPADIDGTPIDGGKVNWFGDGVSGTGLSKTVTYTTAGTKTITAETCGESKSVTITVVEVQTITFDYDAAEAGETVAKEHCTITTYPSGYEDEDFVVVADVESEDRTDNLITATCGTSSADCTFVGFVRDGDWDDNLTWDDTTNTATWEASGSNGVEIEACVEYYYCALPATSATDTVDF